MHLCVLPTLLKSMGQLASASHPPQVTVLTRAGLQLLTLSQVAQVPEQSRDLSCITWMPGGSTLLLLSFFFFLTVKYLSVIFWKWEVLKCVILAFYGAETRFVPPPDPPLSRVGEVVRWLQCWRLRCCRCWQSPLPALGNLMASVASFEPVCFGWVLVKLGWMS